MLRDGMEGTDVHTDSSDTIWPPLKWRGHNTVNFQASKSKFDKWILTIYLSMDK